MTNNTAISTNVNIFLRENLHLLSKEMHISPDIPENKINNAIKAFKYNGNADSIIGIYDNGAFLKNCKTGILFTGNRMILKEDFSDPVEIEYQNIKEVKLERILKNSEKQTFETQSVIFLNDDNKIIIKGMMNEFNYEIFVDTFNQIISNKDNQYKEERQFIPIEEMPDNIKETYIKIVINSSYNNSNILNEQNIAEIWLLMSRINIEQSSRMNIRLYIQQSDNLSSTDELLTIIDKESPSGQTKNIHLSLIKDLLNIWSVSHQNNKELTIESIKSFQFLETFRNRFLVSDDDIKIIIEAINTDRKILTEEVSDDEITKSLKNLAANAGAVGVPVAAVYISGSVMGLSAAGITSGLATLGLGGLFGLSGMVTGIGSVILIGLVAHKGIKKLTGADEVSKYQKRELMLNMVIKLTQKTISQLMEDINAIVEKLNSSLKNQANLETEVKKLAGMVKAMVNAGTVLTKKVGDAQTSNNKAKCPTFLDTTKLAHLTNEPTKKHYYDFIINLYEEKEVIIKEKREMKMKIKENISSEDIKHLSELFEIIGYYKVGKNIQSGIQSSVTGVKNFFSGSKQKTEE